MPTFLSQSGSFQPLDGVTHNYASGVFVAPSGESFEDVTARLIADTLSTLSSEVQMSPASGVLGIVTVSSGWIGLDFGS
jgi:hypothetical protein